MFDLDLKHLKIIDLDGVSEVGEPLMSFTR